MNYDHITDLAQLDQIALQIENGEYRESIDARENRKNLIAIYKRMLELDPTNTRADTNLIYYLLEHGWDLKGRMQNDEAMEYFDRIVRMNPNKPVPRAHYRLGYLYLYRQDWMKAAEHFMKALQETKLINSNRADEHPKLIPEQSLKAKLKLALVTQYISRQMAESARSIYQQADDPDNETFDSMEELDSLLEEEQNYPYILWKGKRKQAITRYQVQHLNENNYIYILEMENTARFHDREARFSDRDIKVALHLILHKNETFNQNQLMNLHHFPSTDAVRQCIKRLRKNFEENIGIQPIITEEGYRWEYSNVGIILERDHPLISLA
jgi:tetratricopeptide (TPR) repeat protein